MAQHALPHTGVMTLDEFIHRSAQEGPFEILDGEIVSKMPTIARHAKITKRLFLVPELFRG
ncbi:MAG: hypothetical protein HXY40_03220 [Chloroflexi bacterium]|nr:hypothetical protein [Chloroflexota bacterium]